tara:strand:+ start:526 stop:1815 length:1290 start_codon:yes stop_codon:yes gene_type:complete
MADYSVAQPLSTFYGTHLNPVVTGYERMCDRVAMSLGYPMVNLEVHRNQIYEFLTMSVEYFTKFAGYDTEYLVFDSDLYENGKGIRLDKLFAITPELSESYTGVNLTISQDTYGSTNTVVTAGVSAVIFSTTIQVGNSGTPTEYAIKMVNSSNNSTRVSKLVATTNRATGSGAQTSTEFGIIHTSSEDLLTVSTATSGASGLTFVIIGNPVSNGTVTVLPNDYLTTSRGVSASQNAFASYDVLADDYRKVVDVNGFEQGSTTGVNTLFTIEQTLAQQTYFSYSMGNYGFDLISWYTVKEFLDTREKLLSQKISFKFNSRTQYLQLLPQPTFDSDGNNSSQYYGIVSCYLEKPVVDMLKEQWVYQYTLALTKIAIGRVRGKYSGTNLMGGGSLNTDVLQEGLTEKAALEEQLLTGTPGQGDADPPMFFVG